MDRMAFSGCIYKISDRNYVLHECVTCINVQRSRSNFVIIVRLDNKIWYEKHVQTLIRFSFIRPYQLARQNSKTINKILLLLLILWTFLGWLVKGQIGPWKYLLPSLPLQLAPPSCPLPLVVVILFTVIIKPLLSYCLEQSTRKMIHP